MTLLDLLTEPEFVRGLVLGVGALLLTVASRSQIGWLLSWGIAAALGLMWIEWQDSYRPFQTWWTAVATVWVLAVSFGTRELRHEVPRRAIRAMFALMVLGVWGTVPDTEGAAVLMGVTAAMALAIWPLKIGRVGSVGPFVAFAVVALVVIVDGVPRPGSIVGALGSAGMLLVGPIVLGIRRSPPAAVSGWLLVAVQLGFVIASGRGAGRLMEVGPALAVWLAAAVSFGVIWWWLEARLGDHFQ